MNNFNIILDRNVLCQDNVEVIHTTLMLNNRDGSEPVGFPQRGAGLALNPGSLFEAKPDNTLWAGKRPFSHTQQPVGSC